VKVLVLGARGMAGHMIYEYLSCETDWDVWQSARQSFIGSQCIPMDLSHRRNVTNLIRTVLPDVVVNACGVLNQFAEAKPIDALSVNSILPHHLAELGVLYGFKLVHISTDCVFSGRDGDYTEHDIPDGTSVCARTKVLGEINDNRNLTIRTSIIGPELKPDGIGLFHWFMRQTGVVPGYQNVYWNGITTLELAKSIQWSIECGVSGLIHLTAPEKVSKCVLLGYIKEAFKRTDIEVKPCLTSPSDKTLVNTRDDFTYPVPAYDHMLWDLAQWIQGKRSIYPYV
jgi:dTDP-4-dehydrorhamnose reductase